MKRQYRRRVILETVSQGGQARVLDLASRLRVSDETIRRDLKDLVAEGLVQKIHGGVMAPDTLGEPRFERRMNQEAEAKKAIARTAAAQVRDGDAVLLDTGSTTAYVARALSGHRNLLVVTNSVDIARTLATRNGNRVYMAGGELRADDGAALGVVAAAFVQQFRVRLCFLSVGAIDLEDGPMVFHLEEAEFSRVAMRRAERTILVADHTKFGRRALVSICPLASVQALITDEPLRPAFQERLRRTDASVLVAERAAA
ncbi:MAG TPA: DeoR/GlpR family DNA-binding transcription regulator [Hypericibacter adhaerens]|jgi:DeoR family glycerol-3-phosphate regulon repressor|uniref:DeoR family transcriptional regulator n=1 Tax=Hypericibacter adhaerens TaxID=2602016 RepID=A0A5J6N8S9_9PROT|nr:DeoR/GlpR family DNA-binding transcription regulator [Hypericibacter adhaerens]QEX23736.1 DeoR family transcriptional regulator [Hypericibacter adhaerens]HWA43353.1 DeoR/GlpR family DNA-binding transcription regulator [Hypericibacter adhaerens]